jgi:hypothetical protein
MGAYSVLALATVAAFVVLAMLALAAYMVRSSKPGRFRLSAKLLKVLDISIEVDAQDGPKELP